MRITFLIILFLFYGKGVIAQKNKKKEKSFGLGLSTNGVFGFTSKLNYAYVNPLIDVVYKKKGKIASVGVLIPILPINDYKYWISLNYLWGIAEKKKKSWIYGVDVDFSRFLYRYYSVPDPIGPYSYYKRYSTEVIAQAGLFRKLSKNSFFSVTAGAGLNIAFANENTPPPNIKSGTVVKPCIKIRLNINRLFF